MAETSTDDVASELIGRLRADANLVGGGQFTLDIDQARDKLASYQLASPERFVLLLVEAAHCFPSCSSITFETDARATRVRLGGFCLDEAELRGVLDPLFVDPSTLEGEARDHMHGRRRLALAVNTMIELADDSLVLRSHRLGQNTLELSISSRGSQVESSATRASMPVLELELEVQHNPLVEAQRMLLRGEARHSTLPLTLDGERIDIGLRHPDMAAPLGAPAELREDDQLVGRGGWWAAGTKLEGGWIIFVANGVILDTLAERSLTPGYLALVRADNLGRDLSQSKLVRDAAFERRLETVAEHHATLGPAPRVAPLGGEAYAARLQNGIGGGGLVLGMMSIVVGVLSFAVSDEPDFVISGAASLLAGMAMVFIGNRSLEKSRRHLRIRQYGLPFVATIETVEAKQVDGHEGKLNIELQLNIDGRAERSPGELAKLTTVAEGEHDFAAGDELLVRVDPKDPDFVVLDSAD